MGSIGTEHEFDHLRDVLGNMPMMKTYTISCLCFVLDNAKDTETVIADLKKGLDLLSANLSYLKGRVVYDNVGQGNTGTWRILPSYDHIPLAIKDLSDEPGMPDMAQLSKAKYPASMLDGALLTSRVGMPLSYEDSEEDPAPVLLVQANFVKGGLLLAFAGHHAVMDMNGLGQIICLLSKACRAEPFTVTEIKQGNRSRNDAIQLLGDDYVQGPELDDVWMQPREVVAPSSSSGAPAPVWAYFNFNTASQAKLKLTAQDQTLVPYISTNDAISAFIWQRLAKAREARLGSNIRTELCRATNARDLVGLDKCYLGHMVNPVHESEVDVWQRPLGEVAGRLRKSLLDPKNTFHIRAIATVLHHSTDKSVIGYGAKMDFDKDVMLSSWTQIPCCQLEYGPSLGVPEAMRRPRMAAFGSIVYLMPKASNGDVAGAFCLRPDDMAMLRDDAEFTQYAEYLG